MRVTPAMNESIARRGTELSRRDQGPNPKRRSVRFAFFDGARNPRTPKRFAVGPGFPRVARRLRFSTAARGLFPSEETLVRFSTSLRSAFGALTFAAIVGGGVGGWGGVPAVAAPGDRVEEELQRTDRTIEKAEAIVREGHSQRARELFEQARQLQSQAWENFRASRFLAAGKLTLQARALALRASGLARGDMGLENRARRELEVAGAMLQDALADLSATPNDNANRLLDEARTQIERGRTQVGEQHFEVALRLALSAQRLIRQALDLGESAGGTARAERELERTDGIIERASAPVRESNDDEAILLFQRAVELQSKAREAHRAGTPRAVVPRTREARALASRALARVRGPVDAVRVQEEIERTDVAIDRAAEVIEASGDAIAARLLASARDHEARAAESLQKGELRAALAQTLVARRLAGRAVSTIEGTGR